MSGGRRDGLPCLHEAWAVVRRLAACFEAGRTEGGVEGERSTMAREVASQACSCAQRQRRASGASRRGPREGDGSATWRSETGALVVVLVLVV